MYLYFYDLHCMNAVFHRLIILVLTTIDLYALIPDRFLIISFSSFRMRKRSEKGLATYIYDVENMAALEMGR